ncbi:MAG: hypothetical protein WCF82_18755 [Microcoleus sp.]
MGQVLGCQDERSDRKSSMIGVEQECQLPSIKRSTAGDVGLYLNSTAIPRTFAESQL